MNLGLRLDGQIDRAPGLFPAALAGEYATPTAFRRALTDRLRALATSSQWTLPQLQRQFAYDRLLERLYRRDEG